ncbi:hypothetical protein [Lactiplantibacillus mudanjiangensis]|uniref:Uncharacterized protein n=1 Tax=Lactiplantibacillus mudanjiangensis TaxID=1296538 RepID=A0A660DWE2_9LACO|nr:hypothetical protein [Lactiplantibacillus mudanjiangensis]VDG19453.1 hypothetical protein [Lactobacillus pentosus] [Lactiplantibacillus mudanjiangensis]VDG25978.1 hypothetical protein [Lactobacillus pentosus] [Lactiplantibacillus mudanjiangensis]VDG27966.1 hypothetical protein [Lactobacillus pentosus] [Lactiplantibacillus mudanjiangensis]VDG30905.1 hypothetical protein [Lactobacillus pentosus] [Lactiplantibacillus mudanjiangensis]
MQNLIPGDMLEVNQKLKWALDNGMTADETSVINDAVLAGTQYYTDEALEGSYWTVKWNDAHDGIDLYGTTGTVVGTIKPTGSSLEADFRQDAQGLFLRIEQTVAKIVRDN